MGYKISRGKNGKADDDAACVASTTRSFTIGGTLDIMRLKKQDNVKLQVQV
jgi:hypothetical protein